MNAHHAALVLRVVAEQHLRICIFLALVAIVGTAVHLAPVGPRHREMIRDVDAVVHQLRLQVAVEQLEVDALAQGLVAGGEEDAVYHLVEQGLLVDVAVLHNLPHRPCGRIDRVLVVAQNHRLRDVCRLGGNRLQLERRIHRAVLSCHRVLVRLLHAAVGFPRPGSQGVFFHGAPLGGVHVLFQIA